MKASSAIKRTSTTPWTSGLRQRSGGQPAWAEPLEERRLLAADLSIVDGITLARGLHYGSPHAMPTLSAVFFIELAEAGQVNGMTLTTPDGVELIVEDYDVFDGSEEWFLESDDMPQDEWDLLGDGTYVLAIDFGGTIETVDILAAQDNNEPLAEVTQQPLPATPGDNATDVPLLTDLSWQPVTDDNVNAIFYYAEEEATGDTILDVMIEDAGTTAVTNVSLSADTAYAADLLFANTLVRTHQEGFDILVAKYVNTAYDFSTTVTTIPTIVDSVELLRGLFYETPNAPATLAATVSVELLEVGQVSGMTLTTPGGFDFVITDHEPTDSGEEWYLEDDDWSQANFNRFIDGTYILTIDRVDGTETIDILFAQDGGAPLPEITQQPLPDSPGHNETGVATTTDISWATVTDPNVNLIHIGVEVNDANGEEIVDEFIADLNTTSLANVMLAADTDYAAEIAIGHGVTHQHQDGFEIFVATFIATDYEFSTRLTAMPDLVAEFEALDAPETLVPGDKFKVSVLVRNDGAADADGPFRIELYASDDQLFDQDDELIVGKSLGNLRLKPGQSKKFVLKGQIPFDAEPSTSFLLAQADVNDGIAEDDETNNTVASDDAFDVVYRFGSFDGRNNVKLTLQIDEDTTLQLKMTGSGYGDLTPDGDDGQLTFTGTDTGSSFKALLKGGSPQIRLTQVDINGGLKKFDAPFMDLAGPFTATNGVGMIKLNDVAPLTPTGQVDISLGGTGAEAGGKFFFDEVRDASLATDSPVKLLRMNGWQNDNATADQITAPFATTIDSKGEFEANLTLTDATVATSLKKLNATTWLKDNVIRTASSIGTVSTGRMDGVTLFAGIADGVVGLPDGPADFSSEATIKKLTVREPDGPTTSFANSFVAAHLLKSVSIGTVTTANGGTPFGFAAHEIKKFSGNGESFKKFTTPGDFFEVEDYLVRIV